MVPICHVQVLPILSGVQRVMLDIFRVLDRSRYEPHVVCQRPGPLSEELAKLDITCHFVPSLVREINPKQDFLAYRELRRLFGQRRFELVHTHSSKPGVLGRVAARRAGVPSVVHHVQGFAFHEFSPWRERWLYKRIEAFAGEFCDRAVFVNGEERDMAVREGILRSDKCVTIHNGVELDRLHVARREAWRAAWRREHAVAEKEIVVAMVGRLDKQKQPMIVPLVARRLLELGTSAAWRIFIAGSGELENALAERVRSMGLTERVVLLGWRDDTERLLHGADILLHTALWEGLPMSLLEAQAACLPIVASDIKGNREVVSEANGRLCAATDATAYAEHLADLIDRPFLRAQLARAARAQAELRFDVGTNMRRITRLYDELLGLSPAEERHVAAA